MKKRRKKVCEDIQQAMSSILVVQKYIRDIDKTLKNYNMKKAPESLNNFLEGVHIIKDACYKTIASGYETLNDNAINFEKQDEQVKQFKEKVSDYFSKDAKNMPRRTFSDQDKNDEDNKVVFNFDDIDEDEDEDIVRSVPFLKI